MADRDDAPPAAAVSEHQAVLQILSALHVSRHDASRSLRMTRDALEPAARWRLIAWLADGLEPTREMHKAACDCIEEAARLNYGAPAAYQDIWDAILAAAKETRDE